MAILSGLANNRLNPHSRRDQHVHWDPIGRSNRQEGNMKELSEVFHYIIFVGYGNGGTRIG
jgi:hypothetical protein